MSVTEVISFPARSIAKVSEVPVPSVLVVEDERKLRERLVEQIQAFGIEPSVACAGYEAIRIIAMARPQLILLDGLLPEMHGFDVSRYVRRMDSEYRPYIALLTAIYKNVRYQNDAKLKYGINEYLIKPVSSDVLYQVIEHVRSEL